MEQNSVSSAQGDSHPSGAAPAPAGRTARGGARAAAVSSRTGDAAARNVSVQYLRGLAALSVMLYHSSYYAEHILGVSGWETAFDGRFAVVGVAVFFAISGMLMADLVVRTDPWRFLGHRIVRIYPAFLLAAAIAAPLTAYAGGWWPSFHLLGLLLAPAGRRGYYLGIEWTLVFECTYYVVLFAIAAAGLQRHLNRIALVWLAMLAAAPFLTGWDDTMFVRLDSLWLAPVDVAFAGGLVVPWLARSVPIPVGTGVLACGAVLAMPPTDPVVARWAAGAAAVLLVLDAVRMKIPRGAVPGLDTLGDWSYALYLVHVPVFLTLFPLWPKFAGTAAAWPCAVALALALAATLGTLDVRLYRRLRGAVNDLPEAVRRRRVNLYVGVFVVAAVIGGALA